MPVAIVTGAASGIGLGVTKELVLRGWNVTMADRNQKEGARIASELGDSVLFQHVDVTSWDDQVAMFKATKCKFGRIDYVVANAGVDDTMSLYEPYEGEPRKPDLKTIDIDLLGQIYSFYLALYYFRLNSRDDGFSSGGRIAMTASMMGLYAFPTNPLYASAKHGIVGLVRSTAPILIKEGITVNCVCPAVVATNIQPNLFKIFPQEHITPMSTVVKAFMNFAENPELTGQAAECSLDQIYYRKQVEYPNESQKWIGEGEVWNKAYGL